MIERLLAAESAFDAGDLDAAERGYGQIAAADPHNAIALVGLARVAHRRGSNDAARELAARALALDPEEAAAARLVAELAAEPVAAAPPVEPEPAPAPEPEPAPAPEVAPRPSLLARLRAWLRARLR
ncbi:MAG TPA: tetratricopeptide repeat protein [Candidatus Deferrimicrobiaceae bacterium]|nr:tetratricopeptide repeat protein [Candidatus Deferrimicrobiaceae bacterium]